MDNKARENSVIRVQGQIVPRRLEWPVVPNARENGEVRANK